MSASSAADPYQVPAWRIPVMIVEEEEAEGESDDNGGGPVGGGGWLEHGTALWEAMAGSDAVVVDAPAGFEQLHLRRHQVLEQVLLLLQQQEEDTDNDEALLQSARNALLAYAVVLQKSRDELHALLLSEAGAHNHNSQSQPHESNNNNNNHNFSSSLLSNSSATAAADEETLAGTASTGSTAAGGGTGSSSSFLPSPPPLDDELLASLLPLQWRSLDPASTTTTTSKKKKRSRKKRQNAAASSLWTRPRLSLAVASSAETAWQSIWEWEQQHVYWNLGLCEAHHAQRLIRKAKDEPAKLRMAWKQAGTQWQTAATWWQFARTQLHSEDPALYQWECWAIAEAQRGAYQFMVLAPRPSPLMMAKIAAGAVPLYAAAADAAVAPTNGHVWHCWHHTLAALAEWHQATVQSTKAAQVPQAVLRCRRAHDAARVAQELFHALLAEHGAGFEIETQQALPPPAFLRELADVLHTQLPALRELQQKLQQQLDLAADGGGGGASTDTTNLPEIPPQNLVKVQPLQAVPAALQKAPMQQPPVPDVLFPRLPAAAQAFLGEQRQEWQRTWLQTTQTAEHETERARQALAQVDLPQALTRALQRHKGQQQQQQQPPPNGGGGEHDDASSALYSASTHHTGHSSSSSSSSSGDSCAATAATLWKRVQRIQQGEGHNNNNNTDNGSNNNNAPNRGLSDLQQGLWELRDHAERAHELLNQVQHQLEENVALDREFCHLHANYAPSHSTADIQASFWQSLQKYQELLASAASGDEVLFGRLESLPTDPKFQLLARLTQPQLERFVASAAAAAAGGSAACSTPHQPPPARSSSPSSSPEWHESMTRLNRDLVALSALFQARDDLVHGPLRAGLERVWQTTTRHLWEEWPEAAEDGSAQFQHELTQHAHAQLQPLLDEVRANVQQQGPLLQAILRENQVFVRLSNSHSSSGAAETTTTTPRGSAASAAASSSSDQTIADRTLQRIVAACDEMEQFQQHWQQGQVFYQGVIPKLQKLQTQVSEVSTRLAIDRCEYDDQVARTAQEAKDAVLAAALAEDEDDEEDDSDEEDESDGDDEEDSQLDYDTKVAANESLASSSTHANSQRRLQQQESDAGDNHTHDDDDTTGGGAGGGDSAIPGGGSTSASSSSGQQTQRRIRNRRSSGAGSGSFVEQVRNDQERTVTVDDEKVASLVAMEFDPERVVAALQKYDNHVEQALNELLSS